MEKGWEVCDEVVCGRAWYGIEGACCHAEEALEPTYDAAFAAVSRFPRRGGGGGGPFRTPLTSRVDAFELGASVDLNAGRLL